MTINFRGIPEPHPDLMSLYNTVAALKEGVETDAQGIRGRDLRTANVDRARVGQAARQANTTTAILDASLVELRFIVAAIDVRLTAAEATLVDHEDRIVALEP
jgi:hypothetical protein